MNTSQHQFSKRVASLGKKHARMSKGISTRVQSDGLIVAHPRKRSPRMPIRALLGVVAIGFALKALLLFQLGPITYQGRIDQMASGSFVEQTGATIMAIDPVTQFIADFFGYYFP